MVTRGQDMVALLLSEVTSTVSTSLPGESWGRRESKDSGQGERQAGVCAAPLCLKEASQQDCAEAGLAVNMGATFGNLWLRQKELQIHRISPRES